MKTYNVVIIDDSEIDLELLAHVVTDLPNVNVLKFLSSTEAERFLSNNKQTQIDLVLCDYEMPQLNGLQVLVSFRKKNIKAPFIFITAFATVELANLCKSEGATGFILKPYVSHDLLNKVERAIGYKAAPTTA